MQVGRPDAQADSISLAPGAPALPSTTRVAHNLPAAAAVYFWQSDVVHRSVRAPLDAQELSYGLTRGETSTLST
jgi:hypothetical protein